LYLCAILASTSPRAVFIVFFNVAQWSELSCYIDTKHENILATNSIVDLWVKS